MKFMNHKKSRVTDLFRKMDSDNDGAVPRDDFIDGILKTSKTIRILCTKRVYVVDTSFFFLSLDVLFQDFVHD